MQYCNPIIKAENSFFGLHWTDPKPPPESGKCWIRLVSYVSSSSEIRRIDGGDDDMLCPKCDSMMVGRRQATGLLDRLYALFSLAPFQCQSCQHRFRAGQPRTRDAKPETDRRNADLQQVQVPVNFVCGSIVGDGTLTDLSKDGCTLDSKRRLRPGLLLRVHFPAGPEDDSQALVTQIATVRSVDGSRAGLKFLAFTPPEQAHLEQTVTSTLKRFTGKTAGPAQP